MTDGSLDKLYAELVAQHGGDALGTVDRAICHRLAKLLAEDSGAPSDIAALTAMLPAKVEAVPSRSSSPLDLSLLSDKELLGLRYLVAKAERAHRGMEVRRPDRHLRDGRRSESMREARLLSLAQRWDEIERAGCKPAADEAKKFGESILALLPRRDGLPLLTTASLWPELTAYVAHLREREVEATPAPAAAAPPANGAKIVPLRLHELPGNRPPYRPEEPSWP